MIPDDVLEAAARILHVRSDSDDALFIAEEIRSGRYTLADEPFTWWDIALSALTIGFAFVGFAFTLHYLFGA